MLNAVFTWENFRHPDGTLDLHGALLDRMPPNTLAVRRHKALRFLDEVVELCPLRNSEAASLALVNALRIVRGE